MSRQSTLLSRGVLAVARLRSDRTARATALLVGGTASAQALGFLAIPLLTRLYSPEDFRVFAVYVAVLTLIAAVTCMRFDTAIPLPESEHEATNLVVLSLISTAVVTALLTAVILLAGDNLVRSAGYANFAPYLGLVPVGVAFAGLYSTFQYATLRQKAFGTTAYVSVAQSITGLGAQIAMGFAGLAPVGLMVGQAIMSAVGALGLAWRGIRRRDRPERHLSWRGLAATVRTYQHFPKFAVANEFVNNAGVQLPVLLIGASILGPEAGFLFLAMRVVGTPLTIVGGAVAQAYYAHAADYERQGRLTSETVAIFRRVSLWLVMPLVAIAPFFLDIFAIILGPEWQRVAVLVMWLIPGYAYRLIASPISTVMYVRSLQKRLLQYSMVGLALRLGPIIIVLASGAQIASEVYALSSAVYYCGLLIALLVAAGVNLFAALRTVVFHSLAWFLIGLTTYSLTALFRLSLA